MLRPMQRRQRLSERRVKLFRNGRNQAVRIPRDLELPGRDAVLWKEGNRLVIEAASGGTLRATLRRLEPLGERIPDVADAPPEPVEFE